VPRDFVIGLVIFAESSAMQKEKKGEKKEYCFFFFRGEK
jgi:hypothetical protein